MKSQHAGQQKISALGRPSSPQLPVLTRESGEKEERKEEPFGPRRKRYNSTVYRGEGKQRTAENRGCV